MQTNDCRDLSDQELRERLLQLVRAEREDIVAVLKHLAEFDKRGLATRSTAAPSLFAYCRTHLGYSEGAAYRRINAARAIRDFPEIEDLFRRGETHLDAIARLRPVLTQENFRELLERTRGLSTVQIKFIVRSYDRRKDKADHVRVVQRSQSQSLLSTSEPKGSAELNHDSSSAAAAAAGGLFSHDDPAPTQPPSLPSAPSPWERMAARHVIEPLSETRVRIAFTGSKELLDMVDRARDLLKHKYPAGQLEGIFFDALDALLDKKDPDRRLKRLEHTNRRPPDPAECDPSSRRIPQAVRDAVWRRDGGQCTHVDLETGERCPERGALEFDHVVPHALGGPSNNAKNIRLLCRGHNRAAAIGIFGEAVTKHWTRPAG